MRSNSEIWCTEHGILYSMVYNVGKRIVRSYVCDADKYCPPQSSDLFIGASVRTLKDIIDSEK